VRCACLSWAIKGQSLSEQALSVSRESADFSAAVEKYLHPFPKVIIISGPSGVGKDSVIKRMRDLNHRFHFVVTATDRPPRPEEVDGIDYHFLSTPEFQRMIDDGEFIEYALVYDQYKGVPKAHVREALASGLDVIMRIDVQGTVSIKRLIPQAVTIFLAPPSVDILIQRLRRRKGDSWEQIQHRLETALAEMEQIKNFDYVVVNKEDKLDDAVHHHCGREMPNWANRGRFVR